MAPLFLRSGLPPFLRACYASVDGVNGMLIIVNCLIPYSGGIVLLQKPSRGWWGLPGGKVEPHETWPEAVRREVFEETGLTVQDMRLHGVHLIDIAGTEEQPPKRLTLAQFAATRVEGTLLEESREGVLRVFAPEEIQALPMDEGDRLMVRYTLWASERPEADVCFGKFAYTPDRQLVSWDITPAPAEPAASVHPGPA
jgi:8-oxo-dGTP diphosphatase